MIVAWRPEPGNVPPTVPSTGDDAQPIDGLKFLF
jgi:hypothetical protein